MGQGSSKDAPSSTQHVFTRYAASSRAIAPLTSLTSETPLRFSQDLLDALQASPETDSTRSKDLELHIQSRVAAELTRLSDSASTTLANLQERISAPESSDPSHPGGGFDNAAKAEGDRRRDLGRESVQREIDGLKQKLGSRKVREEVVRDESVQKARDEVVKCLRVNDRRPLDCWGEVEAFRKEIGRLEKGFLGRVLD
ncbi:hypothetical protein MMC07_003798 [Pseudocyphellaria aurata]|nr:hypothetical protein [Pseudocyphellaria aurata]